jgi:hypothetical protein
MTRDSTLLPFKKPVLELNVAAIVSAVGIPPPGHYFSFPYDNIPMRVENDNGSLCLVVAGHSYPIVSYTMPTRTRNTRPSRGYLVHDTTGTMFAVFI